MLASVGPAVPFAVAQDAPAASQTQIPLNRADMQLSFAPLVKETTPAVVNVYAARQVQARSPFAGDPFFEQFLDGSLAKASRASNNRSVPG
ncbi:hypothetical protein HED52_01440 [Ochrobactrum ciceri]|uniref:Serine protease n=1 Tax=Brucella ciceri TaxID=391287 RepID=A0ABX1DRP3_9HYPH|nr:hypothetical protein [Brucella ciceri]